MSDRPTWSFLSTHGLTLLAIAENPERTLREIGEEVGITERATHRIVTELVQAGYVKKQRQGRRNTYEVCTDPKPPHPLMPPAALEALVQLAGGRDVEG